MTEGRQLHLSPGIAAAVALTVLLAGAGGTYLLMRGGAPPAAGQAADAGARSTTAVPPGAGSSSAPPASPAPLPDVVLTLSKDAVDRAGIGVTQVSTRMGTDMLRVPGVVEPNAYRHVTVTPLVGGRVIRVSVQLGDRVRKGQSIAQVYSPELADARAKYVAAKAMLDAHDRELQRTQKLAEIGAASRQELERIHAEHAARTAEVESARSRLQLLGAGTDVSSASRPEENATTNVPAPIDGVVTERLANAGMNVDPSTKLFTIVDLSNVWIVADVYERDLQRVGEGARAMVVTAAYPDQRLEGRVTFVDPQLNAATRTARIRVEIANPRGDVRLGMYTDVAIESATATPIVAVPTEAVQRVGGRQLVYLASSDDGLKFIERDVQLGRAIDDHVEVLSGLSAGDAVVSKGSFFLRAEAERLGLRKSQPMTSAGAPAAPAKAESADVQVAKVTLTEKGFEPDRLRLRAGVPARLTFLRTTDKTCATEVVFPSLNIKRALPLNEPAVIELTPITDELAFACGMNMLKGAIVVQ